MEKRIDKSMVPDEVFAFAKRFYDSGKELYLVGGSVRDMLLGREAGSDSDFDFATNARPEEVQQLFARTIPTGIQHGTITVLFSGHSFEVTTYRSDGVYTDGRRPDAISFSDTIDEDLARRDFTVNAIALSLHNMELVDIFDGLADLEAKLIRAVGDPLLRFSEDGLRSLRACRFAAKLGFTIEEKTLVAIGPSLEIFNKVAVERVKDELYKMMRTKKPSIGVEYMRQTGLLHSILPELLDGLGVEQNVYHKYDIYHHNLYSCDAAPPEKVCVRFAALLHDIGKVRAMQQAEKWRDDIESPVFYNHEVIGSRMANQIMRRLKFSNVDREHIMHLIKYHMFYYTEEWTDGAVRRFLRNVGLGNLEDLFALRRADRIGNGMKQGPSRSMVKLQKRIEKILEAENAITVKDLNINGNDIMVRFSLRPGPVIGDILEHLLEIILDEPELNEQEELFQIAEQYLAERNSSQ